MRLRAFSLFVFFLLLASSPAFAGIYRYEDSNGVIHFTNSPTDPQYQLYLRESDDLLDKKQMSSLQVPESQPVSLPSGNPTVFDPLIAEVSRKHEVDFALVKAIIRAESGFNPYAISRKGARGLMQLMPATAQRMNVANIFDPRDNIDGGVRYMKYLLSLFNNDLRLSLAAYNAGENIVAQVKGIPPYQETIDYVKKVLSFYQSYKP